MVNAFLLILVLGAASAAAPPRPAHSECNPGSQILFYSPHPLLDSRTFPGFADNLRRRMTVPLGELGYCLQPIGDYRSLLDTIAYGDNLLLHALVTEGPQAVGAGGFVVTVLRVRDWAANKLPEAISRPLVAQPLQPDDPAGLMDVLVRKVAENLRSQYVAHLFIQSRPGDVLVKSTHGLQGKTPVEWILPLGTLSLALEKPGYIPLRRELDLATPGQHNYDLHMAKRRFYHSRFIYPALALGATALAAYALEEHYYSRYQSLGPQDGADVFASTFRTAKTYERIAAGSAVLAGACLVLTFRF